MRLLWGANQDKGMSLHDHDFTGLVNALSAYSDKVEPSCDRTSTLVFSVPVEIVLARLETALCKMLNNVSVQSHNKDIQVSGAWHFNLNGSLFANSGIDYIVEDSDSAPLPCNARKGK